MLQINKLEDAHVFRTLVRQGGGLTFESNNGQKCELSFKEVKELVEEFLALAEPNISRKKLAQVLITEL